MNRLATNRLLGLSGLGMGVTEQGLTRCVGPNVLMAHKARQAEAIVRALAARYDGAARRRATINAARGAT